MLQQQTVHVIQFVLVLSALAAGICSVDALESSRNNATICPNGQPAVQCLLDPCNSATNPCKASEVCQANYCGSCTAECTTMQPNSTGVLLTVNNTTDIEDMGTSPGPGCICTANYDPVCTVGNVTKGNSCEASCANETVAYKGACRAAGNAAPTANAAPALLPGVGTMLLLCTLLAAVSAGIV